MTGTVDREELYAVVRIAVKDAMLDVLGTVFLLVIALLFVVAGAQAIYAASSTAMAALGITVPLLGIVIATAALDLVPPFRE